MEAASPVEVVPVAGGRRPVKRSRQFVDAIDDDRVVAAIGSAEEGTTGQVRVHVSHQSSRDIEKAARKQFIKLNMTDTVDRNAVLIYLQPTTRTFFLVGDVAFDEQSEEGFWQRAATALSAELSEGRYTEGLVQAIHEVGEVLHARFPRTHQSLQLQDMPDDVTRDDPRG